MVDEINSRLYKVNEKEYSGRENEINVVGAGLIVTNGISFSWVHKKTTPECPWIDIGAMLLEYE